MDTCAVLSLFIYKRKTNSNVLIAEQSIVGAREGRSVKRVGECSWKTLVFEQKGAESRGFA
jgi:hypothetical protein